MMNFLKKFNFRKNSHLENKKKIEKIKEEINNLTFEIEQNNVWFEMETDENLIEACIFKQKMLTSQYNFFLSKIKTLKNS